MRDGLLMNRFLKALKTMPHIVIMSIFTRVFEGKTLSAYFYRVLKSKIISLLTSTATFVESTTWVRHLTIQSSLKIS